MGTMSRFSAGLAVTVALSLASISTASAKDTKVSRLYNIDAKIVKVLEKKKLALTRDLREKFLGKPISKMESWAKRRHIDRRAFVDVVHQSQILVVDKLSPKHAWLIVVGCHVTGLAGLRSAEKNWLTKCIAETNQRKNVIRRVPALDVVEAWIKAAKTSGDTVETVTWSHTVLLAQFKFQDAKTRKALERAKLTDNQKIHGALSLSGKRDRFAKRHHLPLAEVERYATIADLTRLKEMSPRWAELFYRAGIRSLVDLKTFRPDVLAKKLAAANKRHGILSKDPTSKKLAELIEKAKPFKQH